MFCFFIISKKTKKHTRIAETREILLNHKRSITKKGKKQRDHKQESNRRE